MVQIKPLKVVDNASIMDAIRADASLDYQQRVPAATDAGVAATVEQLYSYKPHWNEFVNALVNRIGGIIARNNAWSNPLAEFKRGMLNFGDTIEEIAVGLLEANVYDPDREYLERDIFGTTLPRIETNFHTQNRANYYAVTVNQDLLRRAFLEENGLHTFAAQLMQAPSNSDNWDEFLLTTSLFRQYESNGGFRHSHINSLTDLTSDDVDSRLALRKMRAMVENLGFLSTKYNAARMPTHAKPEDLILFTTPEFRAAVDVEALAGAFHVDRMEFQQRQISIPKEQFAIDGCQAILTTKDFFVIADTVLETTSQFNPVSLGTNYFLHHQGIISASRFVPAVMFWEGPEDVDVVTLTPVASVDTPTIEAIDGVTPTSVTRGGMIALVSKAVTNPVGGQEGVVWSVAGATSQRTYITTTGVLHCGPDETASSLTVKATSSYVDPTNARLDPISATLAVNVTGASGTGWPASNAKMASIKIAGYDVAAVADGTTTYALTVPTGTKVTKNNVEVGTYGPADVDITVTNVAGPPVGFTVLIKLDKGTGAAVNYTVNVTANG